MISLTIEDRVPAIHPVALEEAQAATDGTHNEAGGLRSVFWTNSTGRWIKSAEIRDNILHMILERAE